MEHSITLKKAPGGAKARKTDPHQGYCICGTWKRGSSNWQALCSEAARHLREHGTFTKFGINFVVVPI